MEGTTSTGIYPLHRYKILHLVRHAQGIHNVAGEKDFGSYLSNDYLDAHLTDLGWSQSQRRRYRIGGRLLEAVVSSAYLLTMTVERISSVFHFHYSKPLTYVDSGCCDAS